MIFGINTTRDISKLSHLLLASVGSWNYVWQFRNITRGTYAKYDYKSWYYLHKQFAFFYLGIVKGTKSNIFTSKLCAWVIFIILLTGLLCDNSNSRPDLQTTKGTKSNTFTCKLCDCISHADWLFTVIIVTWMYEDLFSLVTSALSKGCFLKKQ